MSEPIFPHGKDGVKISKTGGFFLFIIHRYILLNS